MDELNILSIVAAYFMVLMVVSYLTGKKSDNEDFFLAGRQSPWYVVAFGMIGASLSGVTFISVPGWVQSSGFSYMAMVFGYFFGYLFIAYVLMPMYYRMNLTSIYTYLEKRFGRVSYKTGAAFFLLSRTVGAAFRLYLVAMVLQAFVMQYYGVPFPATVLGTIALIWIYTYRGGIKTIIWTDMLQTLAMLVAVILTVAFIGQRMDLGFGEMVDLVAQSPDSRIFFWDGFATDGRHFLKRFLSGISVAIVMTGLDQDMMQKNLSCRNLKDAQKNMMTFSVVLIFVNLLFLFMGALLFQYASSVGITIPEKTDLLYPTIALQHLPELAGIVFTIGLVAAAYSSADSALTSLTTSFCVDILGFEKKQRALQRPGAQSYHPPTRLPEPPAPSPTPKSMRRTRNLVHLGFSALLSGVIVLFWYINDDAVIKQIFTIAGYTYGPLLGLYFFGFFTRQTLYDRWAWLVCILAPVVSFLTKWALSYYKIYELSFELLILNGLFTFIGLFVISHYDKDLAGIHP